MSSHSLSSSASDVPEGFEPFASTSAFTGLLGRLHVRLENDGAVVFGLRIQATHLNQNGAVHGGLVATLADNAMGYHAARSIGGSVATVNLSVDYLARVNEGAWLAVHNRLDRRGKRMVFAACQGIVDGQMVFRATAVFSAIRR